MITNFQVIVDRAHLNRILGSLNSIETAAIGQTTRGIPFHGAVDYSYLVRVYIMNQRFAGGSRGYPAYAEYDKRYKKWKYGDQGGAGSSDYWQLTGALLNALTVFPHKGGWMGGIPSGVSAVEGTSWLYPRGRGNPGKKKPIAKYAAWGEFGRGENQPERPIFRPTMDQYFDTGFKTRGKKALRDIGRLWR